jgi:hypothetical protein
VTKIEKLEEEVRKLSARDLATFRAWFAEFDASQWDREFDADAANGRLDRLADAALADHAAGRSRKL